MTVSREHDARARERQADDGPSRRGEPTLVGRGAELRVLAGALDGDAGTSGLVLIEGEAGIGKSRLLGELLDQVHSGYRVLRSAGHQLGRDRPFGLVVDALGVAEPGRAAVAELLGAAPEPTAGAELRELPLVRFRIVDAILDVVEREAIERPVLLAFDDLHWADPSSVVVIDQLLRRLADRPVRIVATVRPVPRSPELEQLLADIQPLCHVPLGPLGDGDVRTMVASILGVPPGPNLLTQMARAGGNPFFVAELVAALDDDHTITRDIDRAEVVVTAAQPVTLRVTILRRLGVLPAGSVDVLRVAAVLGGAFGLDDVALVLDRPALDVLATMEESIKAGILVERGDSLAFRHDLVRDAIYHDLPGTARRALHLRAGRALADAGRSLPDVARHLLAGAAPGDDEAITWLRRAARDVFTRAPGTAAEILGGAAELAGNHPDTRDEVLVEMSAAWMWAGRVSDCVTGLRDLLSRPHAHHIDGRAKLGLAQALIIQGKPAEAVDWCEKVAQASDLTDLEQARALFDAAVSRLLCGDLAGAKAVAERAVRLGERLDDEPTLCGALCALAWVTNLEGDTDTAVELGERAVAMAESSPVRETSRRYPHCFVATVLIDADRLDDGRRMFATGLRTAEELGDGWTLPIHHFGAVLASFYAGSFLDAAAELTAAVSIAREVEIGTLDVWALAVAVHLAIHADDLREAEERLAEGERRVAEAGPGMGYDWLLWGKARYEEAIGDQQAALATLRTAWDLAATLGILSQRRLIAPDLARLALRGGDRDLAEQVADAMADATSRAAMTSVHAVALRCRGLLERDPHPLVEAVSLYRTTPRRVDLAATCEDAARALGRRDEARGLLREACDIYELGGATRDLRRAEASLRDLGVGRGARGPRRRPATGWAALTDTEREVTRLAVEGLTNPEIGRRLYISRRTVETHLSHVFAKVGVRSRVELAAGFPRPAT